MLTPTQSSISLQALAAKYRGAVIEDLQLPPAVSLSLSSSVMDVLQLGYEREFDQIPVLSDPKPNAPRRPLGWVDVKQLKKKVETGSVSTDDAIRRHHYRFATTSPASQPAEVTTPSDSSASSSLSPREYTILTPMTPLAELERFFETTKVAFGLVTDDKRKFVYGVVTPTDLQTFVSRRNGQGSVSSVVAA